MYVHNVSDCTRAYDEKDGGVEGEARVSGGEREVRVAQSGGHRVAGSALRIRYVRQKARAERESALRARTRARVRLTHGQEVRAQAADRELPDFSEELHSRADTEKRT